MLLMKGEMTFRPSLKREPPCKARAKGSAFLAEETEIAKAQGRLGGSVG